MSEKAIRELTATRLRLAAKLNTELAAGMTGAGQDALRRHFLDTAELMLDAAKELAK